MLSVEEVSTQGILVKQKRQLVLQLLSQFWALYLEFFLISVSTVAWFRNNSDLLPYPCGPSVVISQDISGLKFGPNISGNGVLLTLQSECHIFLRSSVEVLRLWEMQESEFTTFWKQRKTVMIC